MYAVIDSQENKAFDLHEIHERLENIRMYLEKEIAFKQHIIEGQETQIDQLRSRTEEKDAIIQRIEGQLLECRQTNEVVADSTQDIKRLGKARGAVPPG